MQDSLISREGFCPISQTRLTRQRQGQLIDRGIVVEFSRSMEEATPSEPLRRASLVYGRAPGPYCSN